MTPQDEQLLKEYYKIHFGDAIGMPKYDLLDEKQKGLICNTLGFARYRLNKNLGELKKEIKGEVSKKTFLYFLFIATPIVACIASYFFGGK